MALQNQYEELDGVNQTWQAFYDNQMNSLQTKFNDYISFDDEANFDDIMHLIATKFEQQDQHENTNESLAGNRAETSTRSLISRHFAATDEFQAQIDALNERLMDSQGMEPLWKEKIFHLEEDCERFERQSKDHQNSIDELRNQLHLLSDENQQLKQDKAMIREENDVLVNDSLASKRHAVQLEREASPQNRTLNLWQISSRHAFDTLLCSFTIVHRFREANQQNSSSSHAHRRS